MKPNLLKLTTLTLVCSASCGVAHALESLSDQDLALATGQDGLSISIENSGVINLDKIRLIDTDGVLDTNNEFGSGVGSPISGLSSVGAATFNFGAGGIRLCTTAASSTCATVTEAASLVVDVEGNSGQPYVNIQFQTNHTGLYIPLDSISVAGGQQATTAAGTQWANEIETIKFTRNDGAGNITPGYIEINSFTPLQANIQLGNDTGGTAQGATIFIDPIAFSEIDFGTLNFVSYNSANPPSSVSIADITTPGSGISKGSFDMFMSNVVLLGGATVDVDGVEGVVVQVPTLNVGSASLNNFTLGKEGETYAADGLNNASIGNFTLNNVSATDVRVTVNGL